MRTRKIMSAAGKAALGALMTGCLVAGMASAQQRYGGDPAEPAKPVAKQKSPARLNRAIERRSVDTKSMMDLINQLVSCGTRLTLSSWTDPKRGIGCGRDFVVARLNAIAKESGGKLEVVVDKFESKSERTGPNPVHLENVYAILKGSDAQLAKNVFIVVG